ncbi:MAG: tRNA lysidine(34) synthetase TilS [Clostridia bacterium]|nr:tRNA lysidine(34) synthetase TilS [Clostridia bacterium]
MLKDDILKTIKKYNLVETNDKVVIAVSGGPDSMCLLHFFISIRKEYNLELFVCHVNHGIREESTDEEYFVENFCKKHNIKFFIKRVNLPEICKKEKKGLEEKGREIRYSFFDEVLKKTGSNKIAIAHNLNDYTETVLMNIFRGSGVKGLRGIEVKSGNYIRPLINCKRRDIEEYCEENNLEPKHDKSNDDNTYTRNRIRNVVIPYIQKEFNPSFVDSIYRLSEISKEEGEYIEKMTELAYEDILVEDTKDRIILDLKKFNGLELVIKRRLIIGCIKRIFGTSKGIEKIHIEDIIKLCGNNIGNKYLTPNKNTRVSVGKGHIIIERI